MDQETTAPVEPLSETDNMPTTDASNPFPCRKGCSRSFPSMPSRNMHEIRAHGRNWDTSKNLKRYNKGRKKKSYRFPSDDPEYRAKRYPYYNVRGKAGIKARRKGRKMTASEKRHLSIAMRESWKAKREHQNGVAPVEQPSNNLGQAAEAIILTAQVLRSVSLGLKL